MEVYLKCIILDFYGIPGCGKSSVSHLIADYLRTKGKKVAEPSYDMDHLLNSIYRRQKKLKLALKYYFSNPKGSKHIFMIIKLCGYCKFLDVLSNYVNISYKIQFYNIYHGLYDFIVFDEGMSQSAISLSMNSPNLVKKVCGYLNQLSGFEMVYRFYIEIPVETALKRINSRLIHNSRVEQVKGKINQIEMLNKFDMCFRNSGLQHFKVNGEMNIDDEVEEIARILHIIDVSNKVSK